MCLPPSRRSRWRFLRYSETPYTSVTGRCTCFATWAPRFSTTLLNSGFCHTMSFPISRCLLPRFGEWLQTATCWNGRPITKSQTQGGKFAKEVCPSMLILPVAGIALMLGGAGVMPLLILPFFFLSCISWHLFVGVFKARKDGIQRHHNGLRRKNLWIFQVYAQGRLAYRRQPSDKALQRNVVHDLANKYRYADYRRDFGALPRFHRRGRNG